MADTMPDLTGDSHLLRSDGKRRMARATLRDVRKADLDEVAMVVIGQVVNRVKGTLSLKEFAVLINRDARQVARWIAGKEHAQIAAIFNVPRFRGALVVALADIAGVETETVIRIRRA